MNHILCSFSVCALLAAASLVSAEPVFVQNPTISTGFLLGGGNSVRFADDFELTEPETVRSVSWRGFFQNNPPPLPATFSVAILTNDDNNDLPSVALSSTDVTFTNLSQLTDTGLTQGTSNDIVYEFFANVPTVDLEAATKYWFALRIEASADSNNAFFWANGPADNGSNLNAVQNLNGNYNLFNSSAFSFGLDDEAVTDNIPEPSTLCLLAGAACLLLRRRLFDLFH